MKRLITQKLIEWKEKKNRKPLMLRGARQVGKTWSVMDFGRQHFKGSVHLVDLEKHPDWHGLFDRNLDVSRILSELEVLLNTSIVPGRDLLFFDEVQSCPRAITALRYFYEEMPQLHVIAAGSLLEFTMRDISFPVGRLEMIQMNPMGFIEFLWA
ncbi:AAA family ATPase, partial [bacterium]|nr:AAA family ATPase [bacterium]